MQFTLTWRAQEKSGLMKSLLAAAALSILAGCGGSGSASSSSAPTPAPAPDGALTEMATARVTVDAKNNQVRIEEASPDGRAAFAPGAVTFPTATISDESGSTGRKVMLMYVRNNKTEEIGVDGKLRVTFSGFSNITANPTDLRPTSDVATIAGSDQGGTNDGSALGNVIQDAGAVYVEDRAVYFTSRTDGKVKKLENGQVTTLASGLIQPQGIAGSISTSSLFVSDTGRNRIVRIPKGGGSPVVVSGSPAGAASDVLGAPADARYNAPLGLYLEGFRTQGLSEGHRLWIADSNNNKIKVLEDPFVTAIATAFSATTGKPQQLVGHRVANSTMLFATTKNNLVQALPMMALPPAAATIAGTGTAGLVEGIGSIAQFNDPQGIAAAENALFVADKGNGRVRQLILNEGGAPGSMSSWRAASLAGTAPGAAVDAVGILAVFASPGPMFYDGELGLVMGDQHRLRKITAARLPIVVGAEGGSTSTSKVSIANPDGYSGQERPYFFTLGNLSPGTAQQIAPVSFVVPDGVNMFTFNITVEGALEAPSVLDAKEGSGSTQVFAQRMAGDPGVAAFQDGAGVAARFATIRGIHRVPSGALYIADRGNHAIRRMDDRGEVTTIMGHPSKSAAFAAGTGVTAAVPNPNFVWMNDAETEGFILTDTLVLRLSRAGGDPKAIASWSVALIGGGAAQFADGIGGNARFNGLRGMVRVSDTEFLLTDMINGRIRRMTQIGTDRNNPLSWNYTTLTSGLAKPIQIARSMQGAYYVSAEAGLVYQVWANGASSELSGSAVLNGYVDGVRQQARYGGVYGVAVDSSGYIYASEFNGRIRRTSLNSNRTATVIKGEVVDGAEGRGNTASLGQSNSSLALLPDGDLLASDNRTIWAIRRVVGQ